MHATASTLREEAKLSIILAEIRNTLTIFMATEDAKSHLFSCSGKMLHITFFMLRKEAIDYIFMLRKGATSSTVYDEENTLQLQRKSKSLWEIGKESRKSGILAVFP